jgi:hypothetical protein
VNKGENAVKNFVALLGVLFLFSCAAKGQSVTKLTWQEFKDFCDNDTLPGSLTIGGKASVEITIVSISGTDLLGTNLYIYSVVPVSGIQIADENTNDFSKALADAFNDVLILTTKGFFDSYPEIIAKGEKSEEQKVMLVFEIIKDEITGKLDFKPLDIQSL